MNIQPLTLGFIGGGLNSAVGTTHRIAAEMDKRWKVTAGCFSTHEDTNRNTAETWGISPERLYPAWKDFLASEKNKLDAVVVLTPTPSHFKIVIEALNQGFNVICEKALAVSSTEAMEIQNTAKKNNAFIAVTYNYTGYPMLRELKLMVEKGRLGRLNQIHIEMPQEGYSRLNAEGKPNIPQRWRLEDTGLPTLSLDLGVHLHHMIHFLSGETPLEVVALHDTYGNFKEVIDNAMCIARYTGNLACQIWYSKSALGHRNGLRVRVYGEEGSAEWYQMDPEHIKFCDNRGTYSLIDRTAVSLDLSSELRYNRFKAGHPAGFIEAFANHYFDIAESFINFKNNRQADSPWVFDAELAAEGLKMFEAVADSSKNKSWQRV